MKRKRNCNESAVGIGAMIVFIASVLLACIILFSMIQMTERLVQIPEETLFDSTREIADKIIVKCLSHFVSLRGGYYFENNIFIPVMNMLDKGL